VLAFPLELDLELPVTMLLLQQWILLQMSAVTNLTVSLVHPFEVGNMAQNEKRSLASPQPTSNDEPSQMRAQITYDRSGNPPTPSFRDNSMSPAQAPSLCAV